MVPQFTGDQMEATQGPFLLSCFLHAVSSPPREFVGSHLQVVNLKLLGGPDYPMHGPDLKVRMTLQPAEKGEAGTWKFTHLV